ncbi:STE3-like pheromone receptor [Auriscalpium vulgare]|uniref:STE3-like pheromone receptor n=1 Tax=Auriscalpium vulgare TaxID=40419 RepID=A0ACB8R8U7_9AGAM|nr:STE3-like pheromone receptor [Auriscalpium vulgare]
MSDPTYPLFPICAFLGFLVAFIPLPWHIQAWNAGTCLFMFWAGLASLNQFINSLVWHSNISNPAPIWCDISAKFIIGAGVGIPASSLCINRRLYILTRVNTVSITVKDKIRNVYIDLAIGMGLPILVMIMHVVVQGHRFNILEDVGCIPVIYNTPPAYPLVFMWPVVIGCVSFVYAGLTLRAFLRRRASMSDILSANTTLNVNRYFRLMLLACIEMSCAVPLTAFSIHINTSGVSLAPWISWADTHFDFGRIDKVPSSVWRSDHAFKVSVEMGRWIYPTCAFIFFALFGFASEARKHYRQAWVWLAPRIYLSRFLPRFRTAHSPATSCQPLRVTPRGPIHRSAHRL